MKTKEGAYVLFCDCTSQLIKFKSVCCRISNVSNFSQLEGQLTV